MPVTVECDNCFRVYNNVPDAAIGKAIKCKDCGERIVVRRPSEVREEPAELPPLPTSPNAQRAANTGASRRKTPSTKRRAAAAGSSSSTSSNIKYVAIVILGLVISVGGFLAKRGGRIARAINRHNQEQAEPGPPSVAELVREADRLESQAASKRRTLETLNKGDDGYLQAQVDLSALQNKRRKIILSTIDATGGSTSEADDELIELRRHAFAEDLSAKRESRSVGTLLAKMTTDEYRSFETEFRTLGPGAAAALTQDIPIGFAIDDQPFLRQRQETLGEILGRYPQTAPMGAAVARMSLAEYREYELQTIRGNEAATKQTLALAFRLRPEDVEIDETGFHFPENVHDGIVNALRTEFEKFVEGGAKTAPPTVTGASSTR